MGGITGTLSKVFAPDPPKSEAGRDQWPSRTSFILAAMGGCVGIGNLLRYPSQVYNNYGLQWFIPYFMALLFLGIPLLILEIAIGQAYRGGCVIAYDHMNKRLKGLGFSLVWNGYIVVSYYVPILAWVMTYFRHSFSNPLPWQGDHVNFYYNEVIRNPDPIPGNIVNASVSQYTEYSGTGLIGETVGWCAFTWFIVWLCMYKGVGITGRVVYFTMGLPVVTMIILLGRGVSLPNAIDGIRLYMATWRGELLGDGYIWQMACGQIFFSIGLGMGYFTSYASYNNQHQNVVQDVLIIVICNSLYEIVGCFAVFGIIGFLQQFPQPGDDPIGSFDIAFLTYPAGVAEMPGAQFWSFLFFFTIMILGFSSAFALQDTLVTMIMDGEFARKWNRIYVSSISVVVSFLISLLYCTEFGYYLLDAVDTWINNMSLLFVVWCECVAATTIYRHKDVVGLLGWPAYIIFNVGYVGGQLFGCVVGHTVSPEVGAGMGFGLFFVCFTVALLVAKTPDSAPPSLWNRNLWLEKTYYLGFYSGLQLTRDLNLVVATGKNWPIPFYWGALVRYCSAPILAIVFSLGYPAFVAVRFDPLQIFGFVVGQLAMVIIAIGLVFPRMMDPFVPVERRGEGKIPFSPNLAVASAELSIGQQLETGEGTHARGNVIQPGSNKDLMSGLEK
ncbi:hypothetical protein Daus18300_010108 [Diaporthe australafricana]|uniref:Sodium:neurotransmitter symporter family protein n=1 Tax=Diaporthe australafricana TaxID=127596 RepID=A0ABR3WBJ2_9PEZI